MEKSSQQPQNTEAHNEKYEEARQYLKKLFANKEKPKEVEKFYSEIRLFADVAKLDSNSLIEKVKIGLNLENPEEFTNLSFETLKELIDFRIDHPEIFAEVRRERVIQEEGNIKLSELLFYNVDLENGTAFIHVAPKGDLGLGEVIKAFRSGMVELAKQVKEDERIKEIQATSWIVASNPGLLEKAGFKVEGAITEEMRATHFNDEDKPVAWAHMSREELLEKYLD